MAPRLDRATQVDSDSDALGQVTAELLDAMERDLAVVVAPKWSVRRVFNNDDAPVPLSRNRFQVLSSVDELGNSGEFVPTHVDSAAFDMPFADSPVEVDRVAERNQ